MSNWDAVNLAGSSPEGFCLLVPSGTCPQHGHRLPASLSGSLCPQRPLKPAVCPECSQQGPKMRWAGPSLEIPSSPRGQGPRGQLSIVTDMSRQTPVHTRGLPGAPLSPACSRIPRSKRLARFPRGQPRTARLHPTPPNLTPEVPFMVEEAQPGIHLGGICEPWG